MQEGVAWIAGVGAQAGLGAALARTYAGRGLTARNRKALARLADVIASLPLAIHVEGDVPFNVTHADLHPIGSRQSCLFSEETICVHKADIVTSSKENITAALKTDLLALCFGQHSVRVSPTPWGELPLTYVGHSPLRHVTVHNSYVYVDQGVCARTSKRATPTMPTVLDHRRFACWLGGVATACRRTAAAPIRATEGAGIPLGSDALA